MAKTAPKKAVSQPSLPDAFSLFGPSWAAFRLNIDAFALLLLFPIGAAMLAALTMGAATETGYKAAGIVPALILLAAILIGLVASAALIYLQLKSAQGVRTRFEAAFKEGMRYVLRLVGLLLLSGIIIAIGFLLLIIPGLFAIQRLLLAPYYLVDKNIGIRESIRLSWAAGKKYSAALWGVTGIIIAINFVSVIPVIGWVAGLVLTVVYMCAPPLRYLQIKKFKKS